MKQNSTSENLIKVAVIPDIHGSTEWKKIKDRLDEFDKIVFLGDFFDSWTNIWPDQGENFKEIIELKKIYPDKIELLLGNHDTQYIHGWRCSGHQEDRKLEIKGILGENKDLFSIVFIYKNWIFSHAGVSQTWLDNWEIKPEEINDLYLTNPKCVAHTGNSPSGDDPRNGPLWIRPRSLNKYPAKGYSQIIGHTELPAVPEVYRDYDEYIILIDSYDHEYIHEMEI
jgi:hypothetical protein